MGSGISGKSWAVATGAVLVFGVGLGAAALGAHAATLSIQYDISSSAVAFNFVDQPLTDGTLTLSYPAAGINGPVPSGPATLQTLNLYIASPVPFTVTTVWSVPGYYEYHYTVLSALGPIALALANPLTGFAVGAGGDVQFRIQPAAFNMQGTLHCLGAGCPSTRITGAFPVTQLFSGYDFGRNITGSGPADLNYGVFWFDDYSDFYEASILKISLTGTEIARTLPEPSAPLLHGAALAGLVSLAALRGSPRPRLRSSPRRSV